MPNPKVSAAPAGVKWLTPPQAAGLIGCSYQTVRNYIALGRLKAYRPLGVGRGKRMKVRRKDAEALRDRLRRHSDFRTTG